MGISIIGGASGAAADVDPTQLAQRVAVYPIEATNGRYRLGAASGLITTIVARTATAGHIFAWRWGASAPSIAKVHRISIAVRTVTGFTAAQEFQMGLWKLTGYSASHTAQTAITLTGSELKKDTGENVTLLTDARIAGAAALTAGTHTFAASPIATDGFSELAAAATVPKGRFDFGFNMNEDAETAGPLVFRTNEGFVITNEVLMGAGGTARVHVIVDWTETDSL
jgi:hypothetical protein